MRSPAHIAYDAYCDHTGWKSLATGQTLPPWDQLPRSIQEAWEAAANALIGSSEAQGLARA